MEKIRFLVSIFVLLLVFDVRANDTKDRINVLERKIDALERRVETLTDLRKQSETNIRGNSVTFVENDIIPEIENSDSLNLNSPRNINTDNYTQKENIVKNSDEKIQKLYSEAIKEIRMQNYDIAADALKKITVGNGSGSLVTKGLIANANYLLGEIAFKNKNYELASDRSLTAYEEFTKLNKDDIQAAHSLLQLSKSLSLMDKKEGACNTLKKIEKDFPKLPIALQEKLEVENSKLSCS